MEEKIKEIKKIIKKDINFLLNEKRIKGLFMDVFANESAHINLLLLMYNEGIINHIVKNYYDEYEKKKYLSKLVSNHNLNYDIAKDVIDEWYDILDKTIILLYDKAIEEKQESNKQKNKEITKTEDKESEETGGSIERGPHDYDEKYVNPKAIDKKVIYIPCGVGNGDFGFEIFGIQQFEKCKHPYTDIFALVYNFLVRNTNIDKNCFPEIFKSVEKKSKFSIDYAKVYRCEMILLYMIKNNYMEKNLLSIKVIDIKDELDIAIKIINYYFNLFCRIADIDGFDVKLVTNSNSYFVSLNDKSADIYIENVNKFVTNARKMWYGRKINYNLNERKKNDIEIILHEISDFQSFKEGQFESLCSLINSNDHSICIMPTGSGKSLIYYFASILQPLAVFVVTPTEVLIKDQIRNLKSFHRYDNVAHLKLTSTNDFSHFEITNNLLYLTPMTFQNRNLFNKSYELLAKPDQYGKIKNDNQVAYVVLDEIHCLSHWGHDFRPEYLMLSKNLNRLFDKTTYLGFTATANYSVVEDIQKQLSIPVKNICSPIQFEKYNIKYDYRAVKDEQMMYETVKSIAKNIISHNERAIIFTKTDEITNRVTDYVNEDIGYQAEAFIKENINAYHEFADGNCNILVANEELGIGINFPDVNATIHFGIPTSKNEYVQEVGRAGRKNEKVTSYIVYLEDSENNINSVLLKREADIDNISNILSSMNNDYADAYKKITYNLSTSDVLYEKIIDIYSNFKIKVEKNEVFFGYLCPRGTEKINKQLLYIFYVTGYINDFFSLKVDEKKDIIDIIVDIWGSNYNKDTFNNQIIERMKERAIEYYTKMDNDRKGIVLTNKAKTVEEILKVYVNWFYEKYLYHHKEEFLDFYEFIKSNKNCNSEKITDDIQEYYTLPFVDIKEDDNYFKKMTFYEINEKVNSGISNKKIVNVERLNSAKYDYKYDYIIFMSHWKKSGNFEVNRLERFWKFLSEEDRKLCIDTIYNLYSECIDIGKWNFLKYIEEKDNILSLEFKNAFNRVYAKNKDKIYYGICANNYNKIFKNGGK